MPLREAAFFAALHKTPLLLLHPAGTTDTAGVVELVVDARRSRLLKALNKLLLGPVLMGPMERLRLHSYSLLALMLLLHIACYVVIKM